MKLFSALYNKTLAWAHHRHAPYYLAGVSFIESSFFPIPPDVMLVSMGLAKPDKSWNFAFITTLFSVLGGIFGYCLGLFGIELLKPLIHSLGLEPRYIQVSHWFQIYGVGIIFVAGFSPIPYKVFTIAAGALQMAIFPFILASIVGRGLRFYLVSTLLYFYGERLHNSLQKYIEVIGWTTVVLLVFVIWIAKWIA